MQHRDSGPLSRVYSLGVRQDRAAIPLPRAAAVVQGAAHSGSGG